LGIDGGEIREIQRLVSQSVRAKIPDGIIISTLLKRASTRQVHFEFNWGK